MPAADSPQTLSRWAGLLGAVAACALYLLVNLRGDFGGLLADSYVYLAAARELAHGAAADWSLLLAIGRDYAFPPLFPLVLALFGAGAEDPTTTFTLSAVLMAGMVWACWAWLRTLRLSALTAVLLATLVAVLPASLLTAMNVLSEPLYALLTLLAARALNGPAPGARAWWLASLWVGLALLCRSVGMVALAALVLVWCMRRGWRVAPWALAPALGSALLWSGGQQLAGFASYTPGLPALPALGGIVGENLTALAAAGPALFELAPGGFAIASVALAALLALPVWAQRLRACCFDAWYVLLYLALMLVWPHPAHAGRFLLPVLPLILAYAALALHTRGRAGSVLPALVPAMLLLVAVPGAWSILHTVLHPPAPALAAAVRSPSWYLVAPAQAAQTAEVWQRLVPVMRAVSDLPADACVATTLPEQVLFYGRRRVVDWARISRAPAAVNVIADRCHYVLMVALTLYPAQPGIGPMYPFHALADRLQPLWIERSRRLDLGSPLLAMLARVGQPP